MPILILVLFLVLITAVVAYSTGRYFSISTPYDTSETSEPCDSIGEITGLSGGNDYDGIIQGFNEAFLIVNKQLLIETPINDATIDIFTTKVTNKRITDLLFGKNDEIRDKVEVLMERLFLLDDADEIKQILNDLPKQTRYYDKFFKLHYHFPKGSQYLYLYLNDQSTAMDLINDAGDKIGELEMVIAVMTHRKEYVDLKQDFSKLIHEEIEQYFTFTDELASITNLIRHAMHLLKLNCIKLKFNNSINAIQNFEMGIEKIGLNVTLSQFKSKLETLNISRLLETDQSILAQYINVEILDAKYLTIDYDALFEVEQLIRALPESEQKTVVLNRFNGIRYISILDIISRFDKYAKDLAKRTNKKINPVHYEGENILFDEDRFKDIINGFIELVTNSVEHGIEFPADRFRNNKPEHGNITVSLKKIETGHFISIEDDGRGIDVNALKEILYESKRFPFDDIVEMSEQDVMNSVFLDGISTYDAADEKPSKGTGLFMLKEKVESLGGWIKVSSEQNRFTRFEVFVPSVK